MHLVLAKIWGIYLVIVAFGWLINRARMKKIASHFEDPAITYLSGIISLGLGTATVSLAYPFGFNFVGLLSLVGWISLLHGVICLFRPEEAARITHFILRSDWILLPLLGGLIIGTFLIFVGFGV